MRLASADVIPFSFGNLAETARTYVTQLQKLRDTRNDQIAETNRAIDDGVYAAVNDPHQPTIAPPRRETPPQFNFAPLLNAVDSLTRASIRYDRAFTAGTMSAGASAAMASRAAAIRSINDGLPQGKSLLFPPEGVGR